MAWPCSATPSRCSTASRPIPARSPPILAAALDAADQFLPAFNFVVWAGKSAEEAVAAVVFETAGEA